MPINNEAKLLQPKKLKFSSWATYCILKNTSNSNRSSDGAEAEEGAGEAAGADGRDSHHHRVPAGRFEERAGQPAGPANHEERVDGPEEGAQPHVSTFDVFCGSKVVNCHPHSKFVLTNL